VEERLEEVVEATARCGLVCLHRPDLGDAGGEDALE
jgi:hypothetical protein